MPDFQNPVAFLLLLLIPVLFVLRYIGFFSRMSFVAVISDWAGKTFEWNKEGRRFASVLSTVCGCLGFVAAVVALADRALSTGGMLKFGIPSFRLEKDIIDAEIDVLRQLGVEFRCGINVGRDVTLQQLR